MSFSETEILLTSEPWLNILSYLDYKDLLSCSEVNSELYNLSNRNSHWRQLCKKYWLVTCCPENTTWKEYFRMWYKDFGRYIHCYARVKTAWDQINKYMKENCTEIHKSIKEGATEEFLNEIEKKLGFPLPTDMRCSYRICNGQRMVCPGLLGSVAISSHYRSEGLLDLETAAAGFKEECQYFPLTFCASTGVSQFVALTDLNGFPTSHIFYVERNDLPSSNVNIFISAKHFAEWLTSYASKLTNQEFPLIHNQPFRFETEPVCSCTTHFIRVTAATCFLPELSSVDTPHFFYAYRITLTMADEAPQSASCQLETRHWVIIDEDGLEERVDGPGVVGEYPIMRPGSTFSWISCTNFSTTYGTMHGHFTMRKFNTGEHIDITCPVFHMRCLPYLTTNKRK